VGKGPPVVLGGALLSHLSFSWKAQCGATGQKSLPRDHCFIHYDERGSGLSDWDDPELSIDAFVRDLEAVVDTLGLDRFALIGSSKGGPTSIAYAARHPERVSQLVLYGTFAQGWRINANRSDIERREAIIALMRQGWAQDNPAFRQILTTLFLPDATLEEMGWLNDLQRLSASTENAVELMRSLGELNVVDLLPTSARPH
jgi:pimeloyl-ACP methyl ester carboxylesterase